MVPFKDVRVYDANGDLSKEWYVEYKFYDQTTKKYKRFKERFNINRLKTLEARRKQAYDMKRLIEEELRAGFDPFKERMQKMQAPVGNPVIAQVERIVTDLCIGASKPQVGTYRDVRNRFFRYLEHAQLQQLPIGKVDEVVVRNFQKFMLGEKKLSAKTVNATVSHLGLFWDKATELGMVSDNPWRKVKKVKKVQREGRERFEPITGAELERIFAALTEMGEHDFILFLLFIYYAWARPVEISRLRLSDIDLQNGAIRFRASETKNKKAAMVQIVPQLMRHLMKVDWKGIPGNYFIFSKDGFKPGTKQLNKYDPNKKWRKLVKEGLNIDKDMYALKHTGNIEYLLRNKGATDLKWQQSQNRHSSSSMTERYVRGLGVYFVDVGKINVREL